MTHRSVCQATRRHACPRKLTGVRLVHAFPQFCQPPLRHSVLSCYTYDMSDERARKIKLMLFDVDGVMTDGTIFLFPAPGGGAGRGTHEHRERMAEAGGF